MTGEKALSQGFEPGVDPYNSMNTGYMPDHVLTLFARNSLLEVRPRVNLTVRVNGRDLAYINGALPPPQWLPAPHETRIHHFTTELGMVTILVARP